MSAPIASLRNFSVAYRLERRTLAALKPLNLDLRNGERLAVIGESGSGKSTLARAMVGLLPENAVVEGSITWPGLSSVPRLGKDIGFVFQDPGAVLNPVLTVGEQVAEVARSHLRMSWRAAYQRAADLFSRVGLPEPDKIAGAFAHQLSGGQKQRVAIAAAIAARPRLLVADEATSALDVVVQAQIVQLIDSLVSEEGMTLVFITHDIALASVLADRICVLRSGELIEVGPSDDVIAEPADAYTAALIAAHRDLDSKPLIGNIH